MYVCMRQAGRQAGGQARWHGMQCRFYYGGEEKRTGSKWPLLCVCVCVFVFVQGMMGRWRDAGDISDEREEEEEKAKEEDEEEEKEEEKEEEEEEEEEEGLLSLIPLTREKQSSHNYDENFL